MNEVMLKLTPEQFATMQKLLEPYINLSATLANQYKAQIELLGKQSEKSEIEEAIERR